MSCGDPLGTLYSCGRATEWPWLPPGVNTLNGRRKSEGSSMYETFGAVVSEHAVEFKLFFPDIAVDPTQYSIGGLPKIARLQVTGDFQSKIGSGDWILASAPDMVKTAHPNGILYTYRIADLPDGFYQYKYFVTFENQTT